MMITVRDRLLAVLPGVPWEMEVMLATDIEPELEIIGQGSSVHSRTLLLTDLAMNFGDAATGITSLWLRLMGIRGRFGVSRLIRRAVRDRAAARESLDAILAWDFERVIVTHGVVLQRQGKRLLREAFEWL